jgi:integrase
MAEVLASPKGWDDRRRVVTLDRTKTTGRVEIPVTRQGAKVLTKSSFTVGPNEASTLFSKLCRQVLISGLTFHDSRATALTLLARKVDVMTLARISRHRDLKILLNTYYRETADQIAQRI